jgi:hypothetical protein
MSNDTATESNVTHVGERAGANVILQEPQGGRMGFLHWVGVVGIGTVLLGWLVPKMWNQQVLMQEQMLETTRESSTALTKAADAMDDLGSDIKESVGGLIEQQQDLSSDLAPLIRQMDRLTDAVQASIENHEAEPPPGT